MKIACHDLSGPEWMSEKQYARRPPTICCPPFIMYQYVTVAACSSRLYHMLLMIRKEGWQTASKMPSKVLNATSVAKFCATACSARTVPHKQMFKLRYLPIGTL